MVNELVESLKRNTYHYLIKLIAQILEDLIELLDAIIGPVVVDVCLVLLLCLRQVM